jgi:hypothetical protein
MNFSFTAIRLQFDLPSYTNVRFDVYEVRVYLSYTFLWNVGNYVRYKMISSVFETSRQPHASPSLHEVFKNIHDAILITTHVPHALLLASEGSRMFSRLLFAVYATFLPEVDISLPLSQGLCSNNLKS